MSRIALVFLLFVSYSAKSNDSLFYQCSFSAGLELQKNWTGTNSRTSRLNYDHVYRHFKNFKKKEHFLEVHSSLGFEKISGKTWNKSIDQTNISYAYFKSDSLFSSALNINIYTSILPSHTHFDNGETQIKRVTSRSFVPTIGDLSFGWNRKFWELSYVSFNVGTLRTRLTPSSSEVEKQKTQLYIEYGCSVALSIQKTLGKSISWLNKSNLYFNSLKSNQISIDNIIYITLYRNWQIQIKTILIFDQLNSTNLQLFNAMAFSCVFNNSRSIREKKTSWLIDLTF